MAKKAPNPKQDIFSGGVGVFIGVVMFVYLQSMQSQVTSNPFNQLSSSYSGVLSNLSMWMAFAVLFVAAGIYYLARGLMAQQRVQGETQTSSGAERPLVECPVCKEQIRYGAEKCRFCGADITWP